MFFTTFGFSVKVGGLGTNAVKVKPFGNMRKDKKSDITVNEVLEPSVDIFEETDHTLIVADMPGVDEEDIRVDLKDDILQISAKTDDKKYQKEILLKNSFTKDRMTRTYKNGVLKIRFMG